MDGACSENREMRNVHNILVGRPGGKRPLGRPGSRWEDNIRMDLWEIWFEGVIAFI
jgi:hypothetical protein